MNKSLFDDNNRNAVRELIGEAQSGVSAAIDELKKRYTPLIESLSAKFCRDGMSFQDRDDIREEALINFLNAIFSFDLSFDGVEFGLYAKICIENGLVSFIRSLDRRRRISEVSLDSIFESSDKKPQKDMLAVMADREQALILSKRISDLLSEYENRIWWMYVSGLSVREIAKSLNVESKSVSNAVFRIRKKLREMVESEK